MIKTVQKYLEENATKIPKVLIVEDEPSSMRLMLNILGGFSLEVHPAPTGKAAIAEMETFKEAFELLIFDLRLPDVSYEDVCLTAQKFCKTSQVIVLSGYIDQESIETINRILARPVWFIHKPDFFSEEHFQKVFRLLKINAPQKDP